MRVAPRSIVRLGLLLSLALVVLTAQGLAQQRGEVRQAPRFEGATLPDPPRRNDPWTPPATTLPKFLVSATTTLFEQGLADPRGCDYREIEIGVGNVWSGDGGVLKTRGWVLPEAAGGEKTRFAVAWSGLVYPTVSIGAPADPADDVKTIADDVRKVRDANADRENVRNLGFNGFGTNNEASAVSPTSLHAIKVCLLLRLGRSDLAETVWAARTGAPRAVAPTKPKPKTKLDLTTYGLSYLTLANDLAWFLFDRAVCAHMRGDDAIALADARRLTAFQKAVETKADALGFDHPQGMGPNETPLPYIDFLGQLPELLADHERRAREPKRAPLPPPGADKGRLIAALIADLDQVAARQWGQPGGVSLGESPIVKALMEMGDDAVGPLIDDLERDVRLTRSVHFHRDFGRSRTIMGAHEAAYTALVGLLKTPFFGVASTSGNLTTRGLEGRIEVADRIRAYWQKNRDVPLVERWYRTLADDHVAPGQWLQAAGNIVQHENVRVVPGSTAFTSTVTTQLPPGALPKLRGESLRAKKDPSVAELLARRVNEIDPGGIVQAGSADQYKVGSANQMAAMLAEWDNKAALPVLKARVERCARVVQAGQTNGARFHGMEDGLASLTRMRLKADDPKALDDYAAWVRTVTPDHFAFAPTAMFEPLWRHPDHPAVIAAAAALFDDPKSPWNPRVWRGTPTVAEGQQRELFSTPLLGLKSFRALVLRALGDKTQVGTIETDAKGRVIVIQGSYKTTSDGQSMSSSFDSDPGNTFKPGPSAMPLRMADQACEKLEQLEGIPRFQKHWPLAKRDEAIAATIAFLKQYGERFRENEASRAILAVGPGFPSHQKAILAFDPLDHPATAADVAAGRAIFSLSLEAEAEGEGAEVRRVTRPAFPIDARWTKLEVFPNDPPIMRTYSKDGHELPNIEGLQAGRVWQAEEVRKGDRRQRYYGFVGRHALTRVPAEEIEFVATWRERWSLLSTDLDAQITLKETTPTTTGMLPIEVSFRNHHGVNTTVPIDLVRDVDGVQSIREGITFRLIRESDKAEGPNPFARRQPGAREIEKPFTPEEVPARPINRHPKGTSTRTLEPAESVSAFPIGLRSLFPVNQPGRYRLEITFDDLITTQGTPGTVATVFPVVAPKSD